MVEPRGARWPFGASMAAGAGAQAASMRESRARAPTSSELLHGMLHVCVPVCGIHGGAARMRISGNDGPPGPGDRG